ncbi:MAG: class I SAM-dependent methyltransferase [Alphaproteobacteria bacterium]|nr:class I SAM-dependent methyltransferase [Alphaproteobacteria bacterium]
MTTIPSLKQGGHVVANDIDSRHLQILAQKTPKHLMNQLCLLPGKFPDDIELPENSFSAIHAAGSLHFLEPDLFEVALQKIFNLLQPGGKFYFITTTPFVKLFSEFLPIFEQRKKQDYPWPGLIEDSSIFNKKNRHPLPRLLNLLDIETTERVLVKNKFSIEQIEYVPYAKALLNIQGDGRDTIGVIAVKL